MYKRTVALFTAFCLAIGCICLRLYIVCSNGTNLVSSFGNYYSAELSDIRGEILDCNGHRLTNLDYDNIIFAKPTAKALSAVDGIVDDETLNDIKNKMTKQHAIIQNIGKAEIVQNSDIVSVKINKRYGGQLAQHIIGYTNSDGNGLTGIEQAYNNILFTDRIITARLKVNANGNVLNGSQIEILNNITPVNSVHLTIDREIQQIAENALDEHKVNQGAVVILDSSSGAIRAMASRPNYNPYKLGDFISDETSPLVNRTLDAYAVGSVFKVAVCIAAIDSGLSDFKYNCTGSCKVGSVKFNCYNSKIHGELDMQKALECSCNCYFINLAQKIGAENLLSFVKSIGFGQETNLADGIISDAGELPSGQELESSGALANFSFGQGHFTASMLQVGQMLMTVANGGKYIESHLVEKVVNQNGDTVFSYKQNYPVVVTSQATSDLMKVMLRNVVEKGNAIKAKPENTTAAGKTATAQTGTFYKNGVEICNTWFGGFLPVDKPKYVIVILRQGGNSGAEDCAPIFKTIADKIY